MASPRCSAHRTAWCRTATGSGPLAQALFPLLTRAAWKQYALIGEATHTALLEKNRMLLFHAVQSFLEQPAPG